MLRVRVGGESGVREKRAIGEKGLIEVIEAASGEKARSSRGKRGSRD